MSFEAAGFEARVGNGHTVSLVWLIKGFSRSGRYLAIFEHTTEEVFYSDDVIRKQLTFPYPPIYVAILILMILPLPGSDLLRDCRVGAEGKIQERGSGRTDPRHVRAGGKCLHPASARNLLVGTHARLRRRRRQLHRAQPVRD